jgi:ribosomal protein S18 acetylase RimI-like enzyme
MSKNSELNRIIRQLNVSLRPEEPGDESFLFQVYASTREEELALTNWDQATRTAFLNHQFAAMRHGYKSMSPTGEFLIVLSDQTPVGRLVIYRTAEMIRVVDIALLPAARSKGIGSHVMRRLQTEATAAGVSVQLQVFQNNRAQHLYQRLGFKIAGQDGPYVHLQWTPPGE